MFLGGSDGVDKSLLNEIRPEDFIPYKHLKKHKPKAIATRISEAHANVCHLAALEAKLKYIQVSERSDSMTLVILSYTIRVRSWFGCVVAFHRVASHIILLSINVFRRGKRYRSSALLLSSSVLPLRPPKKTNFSASLRIESCR